VDKTHHLEIVRGDLEGRAKHYCSRG
jgi:hypothetical protein